MLGISQSYISRLEKRIIERLKRDMNVVRFDAPSAAYNDVGGDIFELLCDGSEKQTSYKSKGWEYTRPRVGY